MLVETNILPSLEGVFLLTFNILVPAGNILFGDVTTLGEDDDIDKLGGDFSGCTATDSC